mgnify:CR=1 FL=1
MIYKNKKKTALTITTVLLAIVSFILGYTSPSPQQFREREAQKKWEKEVFENKNRASLVNSKRGDLIIANGDTTAYELALREEYADFISTLPFSIVMANKYNYASAYDDVISRTIDLVIIEQKFDTINSNYYHTILNKADITVYLDFINRGKKLGSERCISDYIFIKSNICK